MTSTTTKRGFAAGAVLLVGAATAHVVRDTG